MSEIDKSAELKAHDENLRVFRDDDREGFELRVLQAPDGDFHLSIWPNHEDMALDERTEAGTRLYSNSIRVRMPFIGGGEHDALWRALASVFKKTKPKPRRTQS